MKRRIFLAILFLMTTSLAFAQGETKRYLYMGTPDGAQKEGRSGNGIPVFDIDDGHKFVRRIDIPIFEEGIRGLTGSLKNHSLYYSTSNRRVGAFDLETEEVVWDETFEVGADRSSITMDGKKIYVPTGWWDDSEGSGMLVLDAKDGALLKKIEVGPLAHNSVVSLDGRFLYLGSETMLTVFDTKDERLITQFKDVGGARMSPYTVNSTNTIAYYCLYTHVGFEILDLKSGKKIDRVFAGDEPIERRCHGVALTPDETELWINDQHGKKIFIFDNTKMPPEPKGELDVSQGGHGWVTFSLDGQYGWSHTPDIFDARTKEFVGTFKDENGKPVSSSKFIEVHFRDGKVVTMGNEFGLGRK